MIFSVSIEVYDTISTGGTITNENEYDIKTFFRSISSWRKMWIGLADLPMMPQHRAKCLKMAGVNIKGRAMIYGGVGVDTVYPDSIYIGKGVRITAGTKILTHYLDPSQPGVHFRRGEVHIEDDVFIGLNVCICSSVTIGKGAIIGAGSVVTKDIPPYQVWAGNPARYIKDRAK